MIKRYFSKYTGEQIDEAIGAIIENNIRLEDLSPDLIQTIKGWVSGLEALDGYVSITENEKITGQKTFTQRPLLELEGLPKEYQAVEYIQSYGSQYIDTELSLPNGFEVEATFEITQTRSASGLSSALFGAQESGNKKRNYITACGSSDQMLIGYGSDSGYTYFGKAEQNVKYRAKFNNIYGERAVNISGMNYTLTPWEEKVYTSSNLYLFAFNENGAAQNAGFIKLYSFIVKNSYGEMVGNYVPCYRKDTKEVGLYDIITNKWFSNKGSGTFSKGQDISRAVVITTLATTQDVDSLRTGDIEFSGIKSFKETIKSTVGNGKNAMTIGNGYLANSNGYLEIGYPNKAFRFYNDAIRSLGTLRPQTDNVDSLGTDINRYKNLYLSGNITNGNDVSIAVDKLVSTDTLNNYYTKDESNKLHQDLIEVAQGKAQTYVISVDAAAEGSTNAALKSEVDSLEVAVNDTTFLQLTDGSNLLLKDVENGQIVLIKEINYPDRFIDIVERSDEKPSKIKFHMLESRKVEIGNVVTTDTEQTITGKKIWLENLVRGSASGRYLTIGESNQPWDKAFITYLNSPWSGCTFGPQYTDKYDLGTSTRLWKNLYLSGNLSDGTKSVAIADIATKSDLSNIKVDNAVTLEGNQEIRGQKIFHTIPETFSQKNTVLPAGYQPLEYIESTGKQYIDTGLTLDSDDFVLDCEFVQTEHTTGEQHIASIWTSAYGYWTIFIKSSTKKLDLYTNGHHESANNVELGVRNSLNITRTGNAWSYTLNGVTNSFTYDIPKPNPTTLKLFRQADLGEPNSHIQMFNFKLTKNGVLVKDFIPCRRESDNMVGLYDLVSDTFFENKSTEELFIEGAETPKGERIRLATIEDVSAAGVDVTSDQEIDGVKTFVKTPLVKTGSVAIPEEYQPVEYVESTGTQYIDTGVIGKTGVSSYCKIMITGDLAANAALLASRIDGGDTRYYIGCRYYNGTINFGHAEEFMSSTAPKQSVVKEYEYITTDNTLTIKENGVAIFVKNITNSFNTGKNLYLFANNYAGVASNFISCKLYALKIYDNETLVRNFIPCYRKADNVAGVYDTVSETFFTDLSGTNLEMGAATDPIGETVKLATVNDIPSDYVDLESEQTIVGKKTFNERPVVLYGGTKIPEEYQEVEYIESDAKGQYINTGLVIPTTAQSVEYQGKLQFLSESNVNTSVWGSLNRSLYKTSLNLLIYNKKIGITYQVNKGFDFLWPAGTVANLDTSIKTINVSATQTKLTASIDTYTASVGLAQGLGCDYPIGIFGCNDNNKESPATIPMRLHGDFKIWVDSRLAAWYVPCRKIDTGVLGLYDVVGAKFLTSTVAFVGCGEDVQNSLLNDKVATLSDIKNQVDTTSDQEIVGVKNFKNGFQINGLKVEKDSSDRIAFYFGSNPKVKIGQLDTLFANRVTPDSSNTYDLGRSGVYWRDLYLSGGLSDGTNKISIATIAGFANKPNKDEVVDLESNQEVNGTKTFISRPLVKSLMSKLPDAYQEVEYIESTGTQYIDTGIVTNNNSKIVIQAQATRTIEMGYRLFGSRTATNIGNFISTNIDKVFVDYGGSSFEASIALDNSIHTYNLDKNRFYYDGVLLKEWSPVEFTAPTNAYLFGASHDGNIVVKPWKIWYCRLYDNDTLVRDLVPCYRKSDSVIGMYDTVSGDFFTNQGTGVFLKGPDVITSLVDKGTPVAAMSDIPDAYTKTESDSRYITYDGDSTLKGGLTIGKGGLTLGITNGNGLLFPSSVISEGGECSIGVYNPIDGNYCTLVGFINGLFTIGHGSFNTNIRGKNTRPTYNGNELALKSDIGSADNCVDITSDQEIEGTKSFVQRPLLPLDEVSPVSTTINYCSLQMAPQDKNGVSIHQEGLKLYLNGQSTGYWTFDNLLSKTIPAGNIVFLVFEYESKGIDNRDFGIRLRNSSTLSHAGPQNYIKITAVDTIDRVQLYGSPNQDYSGVVINKIEVYDLTEIYGGNENVPTNFSIDTLNNITLNNRQAVSVNDLRNYINLNSNQTINGIKTFAQRPLVKVGAALLPEEYQQIEYVESTGTQYIDTGFIPSSYENVIAEVQYLYTVIPGDPNPYTYVMGVRGTATDRFDLIGVDRATQYTRIGTARSAPTDIKVKTYEKYTQIVNVRSHTLTINGTSYGMTYESPTTVQSPLRLFSTSQNDGSGSMWNMSGRVYYCKLYENDELVRDYVPAYNKETKEVGMYDLVSNTFYTNQGTEPFIAGKDVNAEIFGVATLQDIESAYPEIIDLTE